jgi:phenylacetate-CoA ligase
MKRYLFGEWVHDAKSLTAEDVVEICQKARRQEAEMRKYPLDKTFRIFKRWQKNWSEPSYWARKKLLEALPAETGFSAEMIDLALKELQWTLEPALLEKKLKRELQGIPVGEFKYEEKTQTILEWQPLGTVLHVLSGNVFLVALGSLVEGIITGNVNILKMSSGERVFLPILVESLKEVDTDGVLLRSLAVVEYPSSATEVIEEFKSRVDGIVVWGGEEAVRAYRNNLPARTKCIVFGPKLSVALVTEAGVKLKGLSKTAKDLSDEVSIWDQNACTAPQVCFVEGEELAKILAAELGSSLETKARELPAGPAEINTAVEIQKLRGTVEIAESRGEGFCLASSGNVDWTVLVEKAHSIEASPLHRTLRIIPFKNISEVTERLEELRGYIQTVGLVSSDEESSHVASEIAAAGALRVVELGQMAGGEIDDPHDGAYDLAQYGHFVLSRLPKKNRDLDPLDTASDETRSAIINARLRRLIDRARESKFYGERLKGIEIDTVDDLSKIPPLTRQEMEENMPPHLPESDGLATTERFQGGYVSRSGGSTGAPKFSVYDAADWEQLVSQAVKVLRAAGLSPGDRVANCMLSGDLYGSFVSFDHINSRVGAASFAFSGKVDPETFLTTWKKFGLNVIQAMPAVMMPILRQAYAMDPSFTIEKVIYAGTPLSPSDRDWILNTLKAKRISSIIGANDGGQFAFQCQYQSGNIHHLVDDFNYVELLEEGKIVITSLLKFAYPLIRYEIGDSARFVEGQCPCGRKNRVIEYQGRNDNALCISLLNLPHAHIWDAIKDLPISVMQLVGQNTSTGEHIVLRCETGETDTEALKAKVYKQVCERCPTVKHRLDDGNLSALEVEIFPVGALPRNPRTGKVKSLVDERV